MVNQREGGRATGMARSQKRLPQSVDSFLGCLLTTATGCEHVEGLQEEKMRNEKERW